MPSLQDRVIIIVGPTASGKSALAESLAVALRGEIINADVGQFYAPLSIGTAKPDLANVPVPHHLFDICTEPVDVNVVQYRDLVLQKVKEITARNKVPFIVGGSLFYIKSLFFVPREFPQQEASISAAPHENMSDFVQDSVVTPRHSSSSVGGWDKLNEIDPARAAKLHPNDLYRIQRALDIWYTTGVLPSQAQPQAEKPFEPLFIWIDVPHEIIKDRITKRTKEMLKTGWVTETEKILRDNGPASPKGYAGQASQCTQKESANLSVKETGCAGRSSTSEAWNLFFDHKGLIGYREIADWITAGKNNNEIEDVATKIVALTYWYAKRQKTFWKSFKDQLVALGVLPEQHIINSSCAKAPADTSDTNSSDKILDQVKNFLSEKA